MNGYEAPTHRNDPAGAAGGILATAHRPMFLAAGLWAVVVIGWRAFGESGGPAADALGSATLWHAHEMLFGFAGAAFAGYTLTAAPSWSHRPPAAGVRILVLVLIWIVARLALAGLPALPLPLVATTSAGFFAWLALLLGREAVAGRSAKGALQAGFAALLGLADLAVLGAGADPRAAILVFALILSVIGGRMVRAFTENRVAAEHAPPMPVAERAARIGAAAILAALLATLAGAEALSGAALLAGAGAEALRLALWQQAAVRHDALLLMLHLGFLWLPVGLCLTGLARLGVPLFAEPDALHALTAGAMSCLIYAVAARAVARRAPDRLVAGWPSIAGFVLLWLAAWLRLAQGAVPELAEPAALLWIAGWTLFLIKLAPTLRGAPQRPVFSGPRA
ncbi:NnrS family protein [Defluviimonas sp. D31]|uniref:NnrS family protein n=1 Tax=Defluviimonas sp. D31 TaxID=3083253 RepID=UPI00296F846B|nr:NnrS family protein [Defluviimonas sp. D31]MDW4549298.1 NnrS family protein [Defluviimonas sp. D31]